MSPGQLVRSAGLPQHPDEHRPQRPVLLAVDQQLGEGAALRIAPELADPVGALEVGEHQDVEEGSTGERSGRELQPGGFQTTALGLGSKFEPGEIEPDEPPVRARERPEDVPEHPLALDP